MYRLCFQRDAVLGKISLKSIQQPLDRVRVCGVVVRIFEENGSEWCCLDDSTALLKCQLNESLVTPSLGDLCDVFGTLCREDGDVWIEAIGLEIKSDPLYEVLRWLTVMSLYRAAAESGGEALGGSDAVAALVASSAATPRKRARRTLVDGPRGSPARLPAKQKDTSTLIMDAISGAADGMSEDDLVKRGMDVNAVRSILEELGQTGCVYSRDGRWFIL